MATLFLMPSSGSVSVSPTPSGADWAHINTIKRPLRYSPLGTALVNTSYSPDAGIHAVDANAMIAQFVSSSMPAQSIAAQPIAIFMCGWQTDPANNLFLTWKLYATNVAGSSVLGTLVALTRTSALELSASTDLVRTGRSDVRTSTSFTGATNFRLVLEVGAGGSPGGSQNHNFGMVFGDAFADGSMSLIQNNVLGGEHPMLLFSDELLPPLDEPGSGGGTYGYPISG